MSTDPRSILTSIWKEVLNVGEVPTDQPFLKLGGTSIAAVQIIARTLESLGVTLSIALLFDARDSTLERIAQHIELVRLMVQNGVHEQSEGMDALTVD